MTGLVDSLGSDSHGVSMALAFVAALANQNCMVFPCLVRWTGLSQNSNGFLHVSLSLSICLDAMWCIWMAWDVCPCAGSFGESELHGVSMLGALGGQV